MQSQLHLPWRKIRHDPGTFKFTYKQKLNKSIDNVPADITFYNKSEKALKDRSYYAVWVLFMFWYLLTQESSLGRSNTKTTEDTKRGDWSQSCWPVDQLTWFSDSNQKKNLYFNI